MGWNSLFQVVRLLFTTQAKESLGHGRVLSERIFQMLLCPLHDLLELVFHVFSVGKVFLVQHFQICLLPLFILDHRWISMLKVLLRILLNHLLKQWFALLRSLSTQDSCWIDVPFFLCLFKVLLYYLLKLKIDEVSVFHQDNVSVFLIRLTYLFDPLDKFENDERPD